jgi:ribosomal protein S8
MRHKKNTYSNFKNYLQNKLTDKERYAFEKNAAKNSFEEEALEGLESLDKENFISDTEQLQNKIANRQPKKSILVQLRKYNMAASVLVIVGMASYLYWTNRPDLHVDTIFNAPAFEEPSGIQLVPIPDQKEEEEKASFEMDEIIEERVLKTDAVIIDAHIEEPAPRKERKIVVAPAQIKKAEHKQKTHLNRSLLKQKNADPILAAEQEGQKIYGTVVDKNGNPIPGVNIALKGKKEGTISDVDGKFSLEREENATLVFDYLGFEKAIQPANNSMLIVMQEDKAELEEIVVTGHRAVNKQGVAGVAVANTLKSIPPQKDLKLFISWVQNSFDISTLKDNSILAIQLEFTIKKNGQVTDIKIVNKQKRKIRKEIKRILLTSDMWTPAIKNGIPIEEKILLNFGISNED